MHFRSSRFSARNAHMGDSLELTPPAIAKLTSEPHDIPNPATHRDDLDMLDPANDLEVHR